MIKMQPALTEQVKFNHYNSFGRNGALQTFCNTNLVNRQIPEDVLVTFQKKRQAGVAGYGKT